MNIKTEVTCPKCDALHMRVWSRIRGVTCEVFCNCGTRINLVSPMVSIIFPSREYMTRDPELEGFTKMSHQENLFGHEFKNKIDQLPAKGYLVIRADNIPHMPGRLYPTIKEAEARAEELCALTGNEFIVLQIRGKVSTKNPEPKLFWSRSK